jgi:DNA-binding NtrC family response regulator
MLHKPLILIVDDDPELRESLRGALETNGFSVAEAGDATGAMEELTHRFYNAVLLDLHLPGQSGMEVLKHLKEISQDTKVVVITAFASPNSAMEAMRYAASGYVEKPLDMNKLLGKLSVALMDQHERLAWRKPLSARIKGLDAPISL